MARLLLKPLHRSSWLLPSAGEKPLTILLATKAILSIILVSNCSLPIYLGTNHLEVCCFPHLFTGLEYEQWQQLNGTQGQGHTALTIQLSLLEHLSEFPGRLDILQSRGLITCQTWPGSNDKDSPCPPRP